LLRSDSAKVRENIKHIFSLQRGIELYKDAYDKVWKKAEINWRG